MSMKGEEYEYLLALNAMVSAVLEDYHCFAVAFQVGKGKFDDVAFRYRQKEEETGTKLIVLQAKNKANDVVDIDNLLGDNDGDFSLPKYFHSYVRICSGMETKFIGMKLEEVVIFTSAKLDEKKHRKETNTEIKQLDDLLFDLSKENKKSLSAGHGNHERKSEEIFNFTQSGKKCGIKVTSAAKKEIKEKAYMKRLAKLLITKLFDKTEISNDSYIADFQFPLSEFVLELATKSGDSARFREDFLRLQVTEPPTEKEKFFKILKEEFDGRKNKTPELKNLEFSKINQCISDNGSVTNVPASDQELTLKVFPVW